MSRPLQGEVVVAERRRQRCLGARCLGAGLGFRDLVSWFAAAAIVGVANPTFAQSSKQEPVAVSAEAKDEAHRRFDRGLELFNQGDLRGARVEFERAYVLTEHPIVLYNLALVDAALGRAVEAVEALEKLRQGGMSQLGPARAARAEQVHQEQVRRVGELEVRVNTERASVLLDNVDIAEAPAPPFRVTAGSHLLAVTAPGHEPRRMRVSVASGAREVVEVALVPLEGKLAQLELRTNAPDVEVRVGGELIGRSPFIGTLAFKPGTYEFEFSRSGYVPVRRQVVLHEGSTAELEVALVPTDAGLRAGGNVVLELTEDNAVVTVDGEPRIDGALGLRLPVGRHQLRVERQGFFPIEREIVVQPGKQSLELELLPTADYLGQYVDRAQSRRTWSYVAFGAGALATVGGVGFLIWNQGQKNDAERAFDEFAADVDASGGRCDGDACADTLDILVEDLDETRQRDTFGWIGVGVGAAALSAGALLYFLGDAPDRYEPEPESDVFGGLRLDIGWGRAQVGAAF